MGSSGRIATLFFAHLLLLIHSVHSFYLPGVAPRDVQRGDPLQVKVNKLSSTKTQLPYDYYFLKYCKPKIIMNSAENLGEVLRGDRIENSIYTGFRNLYKGREEIIMVRLGGVDLEENKKRSCSMTSQESYSKSINETVNGSHEYMIKGYSLAKGMGSGKYLSSDIFTVGGYDWAIYFYPDGKNPEDSSMYVSVFITLASDGTDVMALFELTLLDQSGKEKRRRRWRSERG